MSGLAQNNGVLGRPLVVRRKLYSATRRCEVVIGNAAIDVNERQRAFCVRLSQATRPVKLRDVKHIWFGSNKFFVHDLADLRDKLALAGAEINFYPSQGYALEAADASQ